MLRSDIVFHDLLIDINRGDIKLSPAEVALYRRSLNDLLNPRGPFWAIAGAIAWKKVFPRTFISPFFAGLFSLEASWCLHDKYPIATFFRDVSVLDPKSSELSRRVREFYPRLATDRMGDKRGVVHRVSEFFRLKRTRLMLFGNGTTTTSTTTTTTSGASSSASSSSTSSLISPSSKGKTNVVIKSTTPKTTFGINGVGNIKCDFGVDHISAKDIWFVLGSKTSLGGYNVPILKGVGAPYQISPKKKQQQQQQSRPTSSSSEQQGVSSSSSSSNLGSSLLASASSASSSLSSKLSSTSSSYKPTTIVTTTTSKKNCVVDIPLKSIWAVIAADHLISSGDFIQMIGYNTHQITSAFYIDTLIDDQIAVMEKGGGGGGNGGDDGPVGPENTT